MKLSGLSPRPAILQRQSSRPFRRMPAWNLLGTMAEEIPMKERHFTKVRIMGRAASGRVRVARTPDLCCEYGISNASLHFRRQVWRYGRFDDEPD